MSVPISSPHTSDVQLVGELYQQAAQALLLAYQRNKQATRHHGEGAFRAALHHARISCEHAEAAHQHLAHALILSSRLSSETGCEQKMPGLAALRNGH